MHQHLENALSRALYWKEPVVVFQCPPLKDSHFVPPFIHCYWTFQGKCGPYHLKSVRAGTYISMKWNIQILWKQHKLCAHAEIVMELNKQCTAKPQPSRWNTKTLGSPTVLQCKVLSLLGVFFSSLQVEVIVSLVPLVANSKTLHIVLILSSSVPVNWGIIAHGFRGHISVLVRIPPFYAFLTEVYQMVSKFSIWFICIICIYIICILQLLEFFDVYGC